MQRTSLLILIIYISVCNSKQISVGVSPNCTELRDAFADASSEFIKCSIEYSRPITFCEDCVEAYLNIVNSYNNMSKINSSGISCIKNFINLDRLEIVQSLYQNSLDLWSRAKCDECYILENGKITNQSSEETKLFKKYYTDFQKCTDRDKNKSESLCSDCMNSYLDLQDYFFSISDENEKIGVCMDIVDMMNNTWTYWGNKCCKFRRHKEYAFIGSTVAVFVVTVLFYILAQFCSKKKTPTIIQQSRFAEVLNHHNT